MANSVAFWRWLCEHLDNGCAVTLLIVTSSSGSSPGTRGAKLAVTLEASAGTIGGGAIESQMLNYARKAIYAGNLVPELHERQHRLSDALRTSGMCCGGTQTILNYPCRFEERAIFKQIEAFDRLGIPHRVSWSAQGITLEAMDVALCEVSTDTTSNCWYQENIGSRNTAYLIGGGHVSLALSNLLITLDFDVVVIDERAGLATMHDNVAAKYKRVIGYADIDTVIPDGTQVFIMIMTHSHQSDARVLSKLLEKPVAYLGLLGSRTKIAWIKETLGSAVPEACWRKLHAPMGLPIHSHTPAEIAVSIAAELVLFINTRTSDR